MNIKNYLNYTLITTYNPEDCHMDQIYRQTDLPTNQPTPQRTVLLEKPTARQLDKQTLYFKKHRVTIPVAHKPVTSSNPEPKESSPNPPLQFL